MPARCSDGAESLGSGSSSAAKPLGQPWSLRLILLLLFCDTDTDTADAIGIAAAVAAASVAASVAAAIAAAVAAAAVTFRWVDDKLAFHELHDH
jgi:hypothetical protein